MLGVFLLMLLMQGVRPDIAGVAALPIFWVKLVFSAMLLAAAFAASMRLARPGARPGRVPALVALPLLALWTLAGVVLLFAAPDQYGQLIFGNTWTTCPASVAMLSVPLFVAMLWAVKGLAPTRLALAGAYAGLLSGAGAAFVYALYCPETGAPFVGIWYVLGILIPTGAGAILGPRLLRW
jgi:hypothetical protein